MTLEEAIKHAEDVASNCDILAEQSVVEQAEYYNRKCAAEHRQLAEWLRELKERRAKQRWIPCSEMLPDEDGEYWITNTKGEAVVYVFDSMGNSVDYWKRCVVAWMPYRRPKPYQEGEG